MHIFAYFTFYILHLVVEHPVEVCDFTPAPPTTQSIKIVIVLAYYYYV